jgi:hypothetical protein
VILTHDSLFESNKLGFSSTDNTVDFLNEEPLFFWTSVSEFNFKIDMTWVYAKQKLNFHILCRLSCPAKELNKDLWVKVKGKNTKNPFSEETNAWRERFWGVLLAVFNGEVNDNTIRSSIISRLDGWTRRHYS